MHCKTAGLDQQGQWASRTGWRARAGQTVVFLVAVSLLAANTAGIPARPDYLHPSVRIVTPSVPASAAALVDSALKVVNKHRSRLMGPFIAGNLESFRWADSRSHDWKANVLPVPGDAADRPVFLAVFHAFHTCESDGDHVYRLVQSGDDGHSSWTLGEEILETATLGFRIRDHVMETNLDPVAKTLTLHDTATVERSSAGIEARAASHFGLLRLNDDYRVKSLSVSGLDGATPFEQAGGVIAFVSPPTDKFTITLDYTGSPDHSNGDFIHDDEAVIASYWYPHIARLPATLTVSATVPAGWTPIAQGEPTGSRVNADGSKTMSWRNEVSTSYFTLDMGQYRVTSRQWRGRLLSTYLLETRQDLAAETARDSLDRLQDSLAFFERVFGAFPYRRYSLVETRGPFNGALEAYSFATFGPRTLPEFIPHELSHTWWGGLVPCTYTHSMWNEAFASYSDDLFQRSPESGGKGVGSVNATIAKRREDRNRGLSMYDGGAILHAFDTEDEGQSAVGYGKGAQVLRVLEDEIGQAAMVASMRAFLRNHTPGEPAEWQEFEAAVTQTAGQDLHWFFTQWLERSGAPKVAISNVTVRAVGSETVVTGRIHQMGQIYRVKLPIAVGLRSGGEIRRVVEIRYADTTFTIRLQETPSRLQIDPEAIVPMVSAGTAADKRDPFTMDFP